MTHTYKGYEISLTSCKDRFGRPVRQGVQAHPTFNPFYVQLGHHWDAPRINIAFEYQSLYAPLKDTVQASYENMMRRINEEHERCLEETGYVHPSADL